MRRELHQIPPAPRTPRWPPVLWARWPLAFIAFVGAIYGGVITLMFFYARGGGLPADDALLDRSSKTAEAKVTKVELQDRYDAEGRQMARVEYQFEAAGQPMIGEVRAAADKYELGGKVQVVFAPGNPHINRIEGERLMQRADLSVVLWRCLVVPGLAALLLWLLGVLRTRSLLRHGDIGVAELLEVRPLTFVLPSMLRVSYRFRDRRARERRGLHWVRARSSLGQKLTTSPPPTRAPLVHDRLRPWRSRVVTVDDFVLAPAAPHPHAADAPTPWTHDP